MGYQDKKTICSNVSPLFQSFSNHFFIFKCALSISQNVLSPWWLARRSVVNIPWHLIFIQYPHHSHPIQRVTESYWQKSLRLIYLGNENLMYSCRDNGFQCWEYYISLIKLIKAFPKHVICCRVYVVRHLYGLLFFSIMCKTNTLQFFVTFCLVIKDYSYIVVRNKHFRLSLAALTKELNS